jgi:exodeoxyribonuclease VII small subunit
MLIMAKENNTKLSIEDSLKKLESLVKKMESNKGTLKENLDWFEEGIGVVKACQAELKFAEQKVHNLVKDSAGDFKKKEVK